MGTIIKINYRRSEKLMRDIFIATGTQPIPNAVFELDAETLTPTQRALVFDNKPAFSDYRIHSIRAQDYPAIGDRNNFAASDFPIDSEPTAADILAHIERMNAERAAAQIKIDAILTDNTTGFFEKQISELRDLLEKRIAAKPNQYNVAEFSAYAAKHNLSILSEYTALLDTYNAALPLFKAEKETREADAKRRADEAAAAKTAEKIAWANQYGSEHLKRALAAGHNCTRKYNIERATVEYPKFILDVEDNAAWKDRSCPSESALNILDDTIAAHPDATEIKIVWLTAAPHDIKPDADDYDDFEQCEAVVVNDPDYKYWLVRAL